jgi:superfamily II RNA helicase
MQSFKEKQDIANGCENPSDFYKVNLVVYKDRHSDLRKFVYCEDGQLHNVHPYAYLHEKLVTRRQRIPENISLSPVEVRDLYSAMKSVCPQDPQLRELNPEIFFSACTSGFISRNMVREFETELKKLLEKWTFKDSEAFKSVVSQLNSVSSSIGCVSEMNFIGNNFIKFILRLQKENMLPAIVFSYDRLLVNYLFSETTKYYEEVAKQYEANKVTSQTKSCIQKSERSKEAKVFEGDFVVRKRGHCRNNKYEASLNLLHTGDVKFTGLKNAGFQDQKIVQYVEKRLMRVGHKKNGYFCCGLRNGLGMHFGGMSQVERSAVEMLFRMRMLNLVFATGTLALGIHMPCKTVAVVGDSRFLNSLEFQQMSGRAGRRGFDTVGNVVFMGLNERKIRRLLTDRLPKMVGNFPLSVSMVLRVLLMVSDITSGGAHSDKVTRDALSRYVLVLHLCNELLQVI